MVVVAIKDGKLCKPKDYLRIEFIDGNIARKKFKELEQKLEEGKKFDDTCAVIFEFLDMNKENIEGFCMENINDIIPGENGEDTKS